MSHRKILITGGSGFIGSHLVRELVNRGADLRVLIRKNSDVSSLRMRGVEFCRGDLKDKKSLKEAVKGAGRVFHLAGEVGGANSKDAARRFNEVNVGGTENLLEASCQEGISKFIHFSSAAVIGQGGDGIVFDEASACNPITAYGRSKYEAEKIVFKYFKEKNLPVAVLRPVPVYGEGDFGDMFKLIKLIKRKLFVSIGSRKNSRSLIYAGNLIDAALLAADSPGSIGETYIVSDNSPYTFNAMADIIAGELKVSVNKVNIPYWAAALLRRPLKFFLGRDIRLLSLDRVYSSKKISRELGFRAKVDLKEGIRKTIKWLKEEGKI